ncbi:SDR family oxidoreductase [Microlunatus soli]|uniref:NAD(P)-dependent dehydrogenase, short-chain alcohol dehydrogenase family n=1 Tax=Microlunatus soli TaxID=630515 RepID=A0A1H1VAN3_9ACTN|nr:SDR family oxidoreductase [Microlunatus soli]SDS81476.1 NAD(P)-dependent dehydrogenase, short-chain alcohol dehydrogenase family [Microlunatus soli]
MTTGNRLQGQHVIVIGGSTGIGRAVVDDVVGAGSIVTVGSRSAEKLSAVAAEHGDRVKTGVVDVTDEDSVRAFFAAAEQSDHVVVCPGDMAVGSAADVTRSAIDGCLNTKIIGQLWCVRHALPSLTATGSMTLLAGAAGFRAYSGMPVTAAANAGIGGLGQSLALELAPRRVNVVVAGVVDTPLWSGMETGQREQFYAAAAAQTPVGRIGRPTDISATVLHVMINDFIDGAVLMVDGGALIA